MAVELRNFAAQFLTGTTPNNLQTINLDMPPRIVRAIRWRVPAGPSGTLGWALASHGQIMLPWNGQGWIVADDEADEVQLQNQIDSGSWQAIGYNTGLFDHTVYITFQLDPVSVPSLTAGSGPLTLVAS